MEQPYYILEEMKDFNALREELTWHRNSIHGWRIQTRAQEQRLQSVLLKLNAKQRNLQSVQHELNVKQREFNKLTNSIKERNSEVDEKEKKLQVKDIEDQVKDLESNKKFYQVRVNVLETRENQYKLLKSKQKEVEQDLQSKEKKFVEQVKAHESMFVEREKEQENQCELLKSKQKEVEQRENDLQSREEQFVEQVKAHESKFVEREKEQKNQYELLKSKQKEVEQRENDLQSREEQFVEQVKAHDSKVVKREQELQSNEKQFVEQVKAHESMFVEREKEQKNQYELLKSKQKEVEQRENNLQSREEQFIEQVKAHDSKVVKREQELESRFQIQHKHEEQFEEREKVLLSNEKEFDKRLNVLVSMEKEFEETKKVVVSKEKQLEETKKVLVLMEKQFEETKKVPFNLVKQLEFIRSQVTSALRTSPDPAKLVLDTVKGFCPSNVRNFLVDELYKTSPVISSDVKEEAIKFATKWKANFSVPAKDELEVMDCFKFIATYDIGSSYQAPQVLCGINKLPGNQLSPTTNDERNLQLLSDGSELNDNGILVDLQTGPSPAQLVLDIIRNPMIQRDEDIIIEKSQIFLLDQLMRISPHIEPNVKDEAMMLALELKKAARGSAENSLVVLVFLQLLSSYRLFPHSNFNEDEVLKLFEVVAHHKETVVLFRTLGFVDSISDFVDNLIKKLQYIGAVRFICAYNFADKSPLVNCLLQLDMQKAKQISDEVVNTEKRREPKVKARDTEIASLRDILQCISDCNLEYLNLVNKIKSRILVLEQENKRENTVSIASEPTSKEKKCACKTVSKNQVKVQQLAEKKPYDVAGTKNQVEVQQCRKRKHANEAVLEVPERYQSLHQFGNNSKSLRKDVSSSSNSVPHYQQQAFIPTSEMPAAQFGNPNRAVLFRNEGGKSFQLSGTHL